uniref:Uncharacterized protein n=1 Tax=Arundo donax TaxID=35708 RepID=A0A0A9G753_ARUDO
MIFQISSLNFHVLLCDKTKLIALLPLFQALKQVCSK